MQGRFPFLHHLLDSRFLKQSFGDVRNNFLDRWRMENREREEEKQRKGGKKNREEEGAFDKQKGRRNPTIGSAFWPTSWQVTEFL